MRNLLMLALLSALAASAAAWFSPLAANAHSGPVLNDGLDQGAQLGDDRVVRALIIEQVEEAAAKRLALAIATGFDHRR